MVQKKNVIAGVPRVSIELTARYSSVVFFIQYSVLSNYADDNLFVIEKNKEDKTFTIIGL